MMIVQPGVIIQEDMIPLFELHLKKTTGQHTMVLENQDQIVILVQTV